MMELIKDPRLFQAIKEEVSQAHITDDGNAQHLDYHKLSSLPLLQSVYTETLRLHVGILITRTSTTPVTIAGYDFPTGSIFQAPTAVAHLDETICMYYCFVQCTHYTQLLDGPDTENIGISLSLLTYTSDW